MGVSWQLASIAKLHRHGATENCYGRGFPFLDRDFLEFMFAIPREQVLRPGRYRSLMRRALAGIVPGEILNRTRKSFAVRGPALSIQALAPEIRKLFSEPFSARLGFVNREAYMKSVDALVAGKNSLSRPIQQTITLEMWLGSLAERRIVEGTRMPSEDRARVLEGVAWLLLTFNWLR
jgi:asparagine synthase (glutamine-hydrolysing)